MGYKKIANLQINHPIFLFKEVFASEKIHGTSCHLTFTYQENNEWKVDVFSGGIKHAMFLSMLNTKYKLSTDVLSKVASLTDNQVIKKIIIYGEGYGGACQRMSDVYGPTNFVAFEVCKEVQQADSIAECWLDVPRAAKFVEDIGLQFVFYELGPATVEWLDIQRNRPSEQAKRNGMGDDKESEGIVVRAPIELYDINGGRLIAKYKREKFRETATARRLTDVDIKEIEDAEEIANEWVVNERLNHVLSSLVAKGYTQITIKDTRLVINAMIEDVSIEATGVVWSDAVSKAVGKKAALLFKQRILANGITNPIEGI